MHFLLEDGEVVADVGDGGHGRFRDIVQLSIVCELRSEKGLMTED
jgi:hypothetical protein